jgi:hypothetical protein
MKNWSLYFGGFAALSRAVDGRGFLPSATPIDIAPVLNGFSPRPTNGPDVELVKRQTSKATLLIAPDNTCGFVSGRPGAAYTCGRSATCVLYPSSGAISGAVACCDAVDCNARVTCFDNRAVSSSSRCDAGCLVDAFTLKWFVLLHSSRPKGFS